MPKLSEARMAERRQNILQAAARSFRKRGFQGTTIADICREAKVSAGAIYVHFESKQHIVEQMGEQTLSDLSETLGALASSGDASQVLGQLLRKLLRTGGGLADAELDLGLWAEAISNPSLRKVCLQSFGALQGGLLAMLSSDAPCGEGEPGRGLAHILLAATLGFEVQRALGFSNDVVAIEGALARLVSQPTKGAHK